MFSQQLTITLFIIEDNILNIEIQVFPKMILMLKAV